MFETPPLLIAWHSRTGTAEAMAQAAAKGAGDGALCLRVEDVQLADVLSAGAYLFACPANLGTMSGMMKEMFDRLYYPALGQIEGRAYATAIAAGSDGTGAVRDIDRIVTGWRLKQVAEPLIVNTRAQTPERIQELKTCTPSQLQECRDLGAALGEGLRLGVI